VQHAARPDPRGVALCLASAVGFGAMAIFAKAAYAGGADIPALLAIRFTLAAVVLWALVLPRRSRAAIEESRPGGRRAHPLPGLALGVLHAVEASAWVLRLEPHRRRAGRAAVAAMTSACLYAGYVLVSDRVVAEGDPLLVSAQVVTGAALCFLAYGLATGSIDLALSAEAWVAALAIAILSTVVPILAFLKGMQLVGVGTATILSTGEPVVTVCLAMLVLGERLAPVQLLGGAIVLAALVGLAKGRGSRVSGAHDPAPASARPAAAREVGEHAPVG